MIVTVAALMLWSDGIPKSRAKTVSYKYSDSQVKTCTVKILKIGTPETITIIVLQLERLDFTVQYCVQKMQTE